MSFILDCACHCRVGKVRSNNEDNILFDGKCLEEQNTGLKNPVVCQSVLSHGSVCFAVFDGMGGEDFGEAASYTAACTMRAETKRLADFLVPEHAFLVQSCAKMNRAVFDAALARGTRHMGSTAAMLLFSPQQVYVCNIGDSRVFRLRGGVFMQLSRDHTDEALLHEMGITNRRPRLTQHLGIDPDEMEIQPYIAKGDLQRGDQYLICSDGLTDMVPNFELCSTLLVGTSAEKCADRLMRQAMSAGGRDNTTIIIIRVL